MPYIAMVCDSCGVLQTRHHNAKLCCITRCRGKLRRVADAGRGEQPAGLQRDLMRCSAETRRWVLGLADEGARLRAEIDRSHGVTADGERFSRGSRVWYIDPTGFVQAMDVGMKFYTTSSVPEEVYNPYPVFSTREAAEAAQKERE